MQNVETDGRIGEKLHRLTAFNKRHPVALAVSDPDRVAHDRQNIRPRGTELVGTVGLVKDDIAVAGLPLTCGSKALAGWQPHRDADAIRGLRAAGAIVAGKASMSEWAGGRSSQQVRGWSSLGGQLSHLQDPGYSPGGSSSGSAVAVAAGVVDWALGSELVGSVVGPASINGIFGLKPTHGAISTDGLAPVFGTPSQSTIGILANDPELLGCLFGATSGWSRIAGPELEGIPPHLTLLTTSPLGCEEQWASLTERLVSRLTSAGVTVTTTDWARRDESMEKMQRLLSRESGFHFSKFLATLPDGYPRSLQELIQFNIRNSTGSLGYDDQEWFEAALTAEPLTGANFSDHARDRNQLTASMGGAIERMMGLSGGDYLLALTERPSWQWDASAADPEPSAVPALACASGYPHVSVPGLDVDSWPVGVSIIGRPHTDFQLLSLAETLHEQLRDRKRHEKPRLGYRHRQDYIL